MCLCDLGVVMATARTHSKSASKCWGGNLCEGLGLMTEPSWPSLSQAAASFQDGEPGCWWGGNHMQHATLPHEEMLFGELPEGIPSLQE